MTGPQVAPITLFIAPISFVFLFLTLVTRFSQFIYADQASSQLPPLMEFGFRMSLHLRLTTSTTKCKILCWVLRLRQCGHKSGILEVCVGRVGSWPLLVLLFQGRNCQNRSPSSVVSCHFPHASFNDFSFFYIIERIIAKRGTKVGRRAEETFHCYPNDMAQHCDLAASVDDCRHVVRLLLCVNRPIVVRTPTPCQGWRDSTICLTPALAGSLTPCDPDSGHNMRTALWE